VVVHLELSNSSLETRFAVSNRGLWKSPCLWVKEARRARMRFGGFIVPIMWLDIVLSLKSAINAAGIADELW
jgi:predicted tellurium resistance membrane protein TerC